MGSFYMQGIDHELITGYRQRHSRFHKTSLFLLVAHKPMPRDLALNLKFLFHFDPYRFERSVCFKPRDY